MAETSLKIFYPSATDYVKSSTAEALQNHLQKMAATTNAAILSEIGKITQIIELTGGEDLNDFRTTGRYILRLASTAGPIANLPPWITTQNVFLLDVKAHTVGGFQYVMQDFSGLSDGSSGKASGYYRRNTSGASGALWIPWRRLDNDVAVANGGAGNANRLRVQEFRDAMGTRVTGGKAAVALRFDHGLANFNSKIRPLLEARNLPYCLALSSRGWSVSENAGVTASMVNSWNRCEVWNHGAGPNHNDASDLQTLTDQIVKGKEELQAQLPDKKIWGFIPPGVGGTNYGGFNGGDSPEAFYGTLAGQLILEHHAVSSGAFTGTAYRPLDGEVRQGMAHAGLETRSVSSLQSLVNTAIANHSGLQLMTHPSRLDESGYHTTAQLTQMLDYIVSKRDAGELVVLSPYEMMVAELFASSGGGSVPGPPGAGVPAGGEALQVIRKNAFNTTTEWATLTKALVGLSNVDNTSDMNKPVSTMQKLALDEKVDKAELETKADLVGGMVPSAQLPANALVTDANVAAQVNGAQTGAAIDQRITTRATPLVQPIVADYIASSQVVVDAAAAAVDANPIIAGLESRVVTVETTAPVHQTDENLGGGFLDKSSLATDFVYRKSDGQAPDWVMDRWAPRIGQRLGISTGTEYMLHEGRVRRTNPITSRAGIFGSSTLWMAGDQLATLLQSNGVPTVYKGGKSGEAGEQTAARIGAVPAKLTFPGNLIPASGSAVVTSTNVPAGIYLMPYSGVISGVHGTLSATATELTFTRTTAGSSVSSPADSEMTSDIGEEYQYAVNIINIGKNGMSTRTAQATIDLIDACFDYLSSANTRVLVLGHFADSNWWPDAEVGQKLQEINAYCKNKYGPIFMDIHALITSPQVWDITGVVPTQADLDQQVFQGYGVKPGSLSVDNGHFNTAGNNALTYLVQATIDNLHWNGA